MLNLIGKVYVYVFLQVSEQYSQRRVRHHHEHPAQGLRWRVWGDTGECCDQAGRWYARETSKWLHTTWSKNRASSRLRNLAVIQRGDEYFLSSFLFVRTGESATSENGSSGVHEHLPETRDWPHATCYNLGTTHPDWPEAGHRRNHNYEWGIWDCSSFSRSMKFIIRKLSQCRLRRREGRLVTY